MMWLPTPAVAFAALSAADATSSPDFGGLVTLLMQVPAAVFCALFILGKIHGPSTVRELEARLDRALEQLAAINAKVIDDVIPVLIEAKAELQRAERRAERAHGDG